MASSRVGEASVPELTEAGSVQIGDSSHADAIVIVIGACAPSTAAPTVEGKGLGTAASDPDRRDVHVGSRHEASSTWPSR